MENTWVRLVLASSIDGRIAYPEGGETNLGLQGDRLVLEESLLWSDALLVGGQTLRDHQSICLIKNAKLLKQRISEGKNSQPISLVVSNQKDYPSDWSFFQQPIQRWQLRNETNYSERNIKKRFHKIIHLKSTWLESLEILRQEGLSKLSLLGGANLIRSFLLEDLIDELQITITPKLLGGKYSWVSSKINNLERIMNEKIQWSLIESKDLGNSELLLRYYRNKAN